MPYGTERNSYKNEKILSLILTLSNLLPCISAAAADSEVNVTIDGEAKTFDVMPVIEDSTTLVPMRGIFEALGAKIEWDGKTSTVTGTKGEKTVILQIGSKAANVNGREVILDVAAKIISDRTMVPARFVSDALGCNCVNHEEKLVDRYFDYVFIGLTRGAIDEQNMIEYFEYITTLFQNANPDVKFVALAPATIYGLNDTGVIRQGTIDNLKTIEEKFGVIIADWGRIVRDIIDGAVSVPMATQSYNRNTFIITKDNKHPNLLAGYITTLMAYCAVTGESAEGQPYDFYNEAFDIPDYMNYYYTNGGVDETTADEIFESESDMRGLQQLVDLYLKTKPYLLD